MLNRFQVLVVCAALALPALAIASPIGLLNVAGLDLVHVSLTGIDFGPVGGGTGAFAVTGATGSFTSVPLFSTGIIADLADPPDTAGPPLASAVTPFVVVPLPGALFAFNLEQIFLGGGTPCTSLPAIGGSCTPSNFLPASPVLLTQKQGTVNASIALRGTVFDLTDGTSSQWTGLLGATLPGTVGDILAAFGPGGAGVVDAAWSGILIATPIPEPSVGTIGVGLFLLFGVMRRWRAA